MSTAAGGKGDNPVPAHEKGHRADDRVWLVMSTVQESIRLGRSRISYTVRISMNDTWNRFASGTIVAMENHQELVLRALEHVLALEEREADEQTHGDVERELCGQVRRLSPMRRAVALRDPVCPWCGKGAFVRGAGGPW